MQQLGGAERDTFAADPVMDRLQFNAGLFIGDDQKKRAALVLQEQVLGVSARNLAAQALCSRRP